MEDSPGYRPEEEGAVGTLRPLRALRPSQEGEEPSFKPYETRSTTRRGLSPLELRALQTLRDCECYEIQDLDPGGCRKPRFEPPSLHARQLTHLSNKGLAGFHYSFPQHRWRITTAGRTVLQNLGL